MNIYTRDIKNGICKDLLSPTCPPRESLEFLFVCYKKLLQKKNNEIEVEPTDSSLFSVQPQPQLYINNVNKFKINESNSTKVKRLKLVW